MRIGIALAVAMLTLTSTGVAQERPNSEVIASARSAIKQLRAGIQAGDTAAVNRAVEPPATWGVIRNVTDPSPDGYSFWQPSSRVDVDKLELLVQSDGSVLATGWIDVRGHRGEWRAVLDNVNGRWKFREHRESWGAHTTRLGR